jgi:hypothetical protein
MAIQIQDAPLKLDIKPIKNPSLSIREFSTPEFYKKC